MKHIWIVAGNYHEFRSYELRKPAKPGTQYHYVFKAGDLRGLSEIDGFYIGTYENRSDLIDIQTEIKIIRGKRFVGRGLTNLNPVSAQAENRTLPADWFKNLYMNEYEATYSNQWTADSGSNKTT